MDLSPKAVRFLIEALKHYVADHNLRLTENGLSDDATADLENDRHYLQAILKDFEKLRDELVHKTEKTKASA